MMLRAVIVLLFATLIVAKFKKSRENRAVETTSGSLKSPPTRGDLPDWDYIEELKLVREIIDTTFHKTYPALDRCKFLNMLCLKPFGVVVGGEVSLVGLKLGRA